MSDMSLKLKNAPIVEAVLDIECDMPPTIDLTKFEQSHPNLFGQNYPKIRNQFVLEHQFEHAEGKELKFSKRQGINAIQYNQEDEKQIVQVRAQGFSFNRLKPYTTLDDYLPEIKRTWQQFVGTVHPIQIRKVQLRYINRLLLPMKDGTVMLKQYLTTAPKTPEQANLLFSSFVHQYTAAEKNSGHLANIVLASQPAEKNFVPIIFDISATANQVIQPENWALLLDRIESLRDLKNRIFKNTLTSECLNLFQ